MRRKKATVDQQLSRNALKLKSREQGLRRARALVRKYIPADANLSGELIKERRIEAANESKKSK